MMKSLKAGDFIGIVACSNKLQLRNREKIHELEEFINCLGLKIKYGNNIYEEECCYEEPREKAQGLMNLFMDKRVKVIFDISGGDLANGVLDLLDFNLIKDNPKIFCGYSDLTVIINPLNTKAKIETYYYQIRNLVGEYKEQQQKEFMRTFFQGNNDLINFKYNWIQGDKLQGEVIGGNLRCFLKLSGTKYMPSFDNKVLFLESLGGDAKKITTYLTQYKQIGAFEKISGIILGSFSEMEDRNYYPKVEEILLNIIEDKKIPIIKTAYLGHRQNSKAISIGKSINLFKETFYEK